MTELCKVCGVAQSTQLHHRKRRSQGGSNDAVNLLPVCLECHTRIHAEPKWAYDNGYLVHSWADPADVDIAATPMQQTIDGREEPWQAHAHEDGETCSKCKGTGKVPKPEPKDPAHEQAPPRPKTTWSVRVPKDEREDGYEVIDSLVEDSVEKLKEASLLKSVNRGANYYALVYVLAFFAQNFKPEVEKAS